MSEFQSGSENRQQETLKMDAAKFLQEQQKSMPPELYKFFCDKLGVSAEPQEESPTTEQPSSPTTNGMEQLKIEAKTFGLNLAQELVDAGIIAPDRLSRCQKIFAENPRQHEFLDFLDNDIRKAAQNGSLKIPSEAWSKIQKVTKDKLNLEIIYAKPGSEYNPQEQEMTELDRQQGFGYGKVAIFEGFGYSNPGGKIIRKAQVKIGG